MGKTVIGLTIFIVLLFAVNEKCHADDKSDCLNACTSEKRNSDMFCGPTGSSYEEDHKQCLEKNSSTFNDCSKNCSPPPVTTEQPPAEAAPPPAQPSEPAVPEKKE